MTTMPEDGPKDTANSAPTTAVEGGGTSTRQAAEATLRRIAEMLAGDGWKQTEIGIGEAALALASLDRPGVDLARYRHHLSVLAHDVTEELRGKERTLADKVAALNAVILEKYGYRGDRESYDDLQNANMIRVIDRRRGLPVTLGILYLHAARAQGWVMAGLAFPGHFLVRLDSPEGRVIIDPFNEGSTPDAAALRRLLQSTAGDDASLSAEHYRTVEDVDVLLRMQNNLKLRLIGADRLDKAVAVIETMLLFAPHEPDLWREAALLHAHLDNLGRAITAIETYLERSGDNIHRHAMATLLQRLKAKLN